MKGQHGRKTKMASRIGACGCARATDAAQPLLVMVGWVWQRLLQVAANHRNPKPHLLETAALSGLTTHAYCTPSPRLTLTYEGHLGVRCHPNVVGGVGGH